MQKLNEREEIQTTFKAEILKAVSGDRHVNGGRTETLTNLDCRWAGIA